jgi:protein SCO1/2
MRIIYFLLLTSFLLQACVDTQSEGPLPILGRDVIVDGKATKHQIRDFEFINQDSQLVTNQTFAGKAYVVDFFFISCPTICPKLTKQMLRIHDRYENEGDLLLLSHSIDTKYDTIPRLKAYAENLGVSTDKWHFVTGEKDEIFGIGEDYFSIAVDDPDAPGGFDHSGYIILVDKDQHIRSYASGTDPESVDKFMKDIDRLLAEMKSSE